jgi:hypothetical protein
MWMPRTDTVNAPVLSPATELPRVLLISHLEFVWPPLVRKTATNTTRRRTYTARGIALIVRIAPSFTSSKLASTRPCLLRRRKRRILIIHPPAA